MSTLKQAAKDLFRPLIQWRFALERMKYRDVTVITPAQGNQAIAELIRQKKPAAIGKIGSSELNGVLNYLRHRQADGLCQTWGKTRTLLNVNAGVFPDDPSIFSRFCSDFLTDLRQMDITGVWFHFGERRIMRDYAGQSRYTELRGLEPYYHDQPWSQELAGKKVLVISPFISSIESQYQKRQQVWASRPEMLPDFQLHLIRCPLSAALAPPQDSDWLAARDRMTHEMAKIDFDVAIIGAGAWSLPLAVRAKQMGKIGIHLGGSAQILFGVKGGRWDTHPIISSFFNEYWVRPSQQDRPQEAHRIEGGCYW